MLLDRDDLIRGLRQLVGKLREAGEPAGIRLVGGAALSLRYFDRRNTEDIDAALHPSHPVLEAAAEIAAQNEWATDWLNSRAEHFIPIAKDVGWELLYSNGGISIWVASAPALLAMKLQASRAGRDDDDIAKLLTICQVSSREQADELYESYYPGEVLPDKAHRLLDALLAQGLPELPEPPERPTFS